MKKLLKSVVSIGAVFVMILAMGVIVSAAEQTITVPTKYFGNESAVTRSYTYTDKSVLSGSECGVIIPLKVSAPGTVKLRIDYTKLQKDINGYVYTDAACTNRLYFSAVTQVGSNSEEAFVTVNNAGTYYLKFYSYQYSYQTSEFTNSLSVSVSEYTDADKTIKSGQTINYYRKSGSTPYYFKYKAEKTGKVTLSFSYNYSTYVTLMNSKKKALSNQVTVFPSVNKVTFAVKKGTSYYFCITSNGINNGKTQSISVKNTAIKEKSGSKKKKAVTIKAKKKVKGTILPGSKTADWYKFKLKKNKKISVDISGEVTGSLRIEFFYKNGRSAGSGYFYGGQSIYKPLYGKMKKGTYYVKISRGNSLSSGYYSMKWK